jgi:hypothetical protein
MTATRVATDDKHYTHVQDATAALDVFFDGPVSVTVYQKGGAHAEVIRFSRASDRTSWTGRASLMSEKSAYEMTRGEDITITFQLRAKDIPPEGIGAWTINFSMIRCDENGVPLPGKVSLGIIVCAILSPGTSGQFQVNIANAYTSSAEVGLYKFDARRQPAGFKATLADGTVRVHQEVTP